MNPKKLIPNPHIGGDPWTGSVFPYLISINSPPPRLSNCTRTRTRKSGSREHAQKAPHMRGPAMPYNSNSSDICSPRSSLAAPVSGRLKGRWSLPFCHILYNIALRRLIPHRHPWSERWTAIRDPWEVDDQPHWWLNAAEAKRRSYAGKRLDPITTSAAMRAPVSPLRSPKRISVALAVGDAASIKDFLNFNRLLC